MAESKKLAEFVRLGGMLIFSLWAPVALADTIVLKDGKDLKGLVVEQHADRVILSTENGEVPVMLADVEDIRFEDPAQNFYQLGRAREADEKLGEALAYYEKAIEANPNFDEAKKAAAGVRNRFWADSIQGPASEMEKQQEIYDAWGRGQAFEKEVGGKIKEAAKSLREGLGLALEKKGDWTRVAIADAKKDAGFAGLKKNDRLVAIDGESLRYLSLEVVVKALLSPRLTSFTLEYERDCYVRKDKPGDAKLGLKLKLEYQGLVVESVKEGSAAAAAGVKEKDLVTRINGEATRYMPMKEAQKLIQKSDERVVLTVRRSAMLTRK